MPKQTIPRKQQFRYHFSVEGEPEYWYLKWFENQINSSESSKVKVKLDIKLDRDPVAYAKKLVIQNKTTIWHLCGIGGNTLEDILLIHFTLGQLKNAKILGKDIDYRYGYSNLGFELWTVLHKLNCNREFTEPGQYLPYINQGFDEQFNSIEEFRQEPDFKRCLSKLTLDNVITAISSAKQIMKENEDKRYPITRFKGYQYYLHNPSLEIWEPIETILQDCGLLNAVVSHCE